MRRGVWCAAVLTVAMGIDSAPALALDGPPMPRPQPVTDTLHGVRITDPYRFLEDPESQATQDFVRDETRYTETLLQRFPGRGKIAARQEQLSLMGVLTDLSVAGPYVFYRKREGAQNQPVLYVARRDGGPPRVLVDVNRLNDAGLVALDWYTPSPDGKFVAYGISDNGTEISTLHVIETATGHELPEAINPAREAFIAWRSDDSGFYYGRPKAGKVPTGQEVYNVRIFRHTLGKNPEGDGDPLVFGEGLSLTETDIPVATVSDDDRYLTFTVHHTRSKADFWVEDTHGDAVPHPVSIGKDADFTPEIFKGQIYVRTNLGAPRFRMMRVDVAHPEPESWQEVAPESDGVLKDFQISGGKLLLEYERDATSHIALSELDGSDRREVKLPGLGALTSIAAAWDVPDIYFLYESYDTPTTGYRFDTRHLTTTPWISIDAQGLAPHVMSVRQVFYGTPDGTKIPMFIVARNDVKLDGKNPTVLGGYGGFDISDTPYFSRNIYGWVEAGGVWAEANLRGGSEYGETWHEAGMREHRQNVFDDFATAAHYLIDHGWTDSDRLGLYGTSNGGLLVGAAVTQHPELFRAAVASVPLLDMLRYQKFGIAKLWIPEFGTADDPVQFKYLRAYSPYHNVHPGTLYPALLFLTADHDTRVAPLHALKMTALLQAEARNGTDPERPILLRVAEHAGHGDDTPRLLRLAEGLDTYSFLFWQLGLNP